MTMQSEKIPYDPSSIIQYIPTGPNKVIVLSLIADELLI